MWIRIGQALHRCPHTAVAQVVLALCTMEALPLRSRSASTPAASITTPIVIARCSNWLFDVAQANERVATSTATRRDMTPSRVVQ